MSLSTLGAFSNPAAEPTHTALPPASDTTHLEPATSTLPPAASADPSSTGKLDPQFVQQGQIAEAKCKLSALFYSQPAHPAVVNSPLVKKLHEQLTKENYLEYAVPILQDLQVIEPLLTSVQGISLAPFFRTAALVKDVEVLGGMHLLATPRFPAHVTRFQQLHAEKPFLLVAHACHRYYAILHGGQQRKERIEKVWPDAVNFYNFSKPSKEMVTDLTSALDAYGWTLNASQLEDLKEEILLAYTQAANVVGAKV